MTGASRGIGKAIAIALSKEGADIVLAGRSLQDLHDVRQEIGNCAGEIQCDALDLADLSSIEQFADNVLKTMQQLHVLVHCGGFYDHGSMSESLPERLDELFQTNVRGAYALTKSLRPMLKESRGDIVFINSTIIFSTAENVGQFAATQHALLGITNSIRAEVNDDGIRVLSIYPGRTATPRQEKIFELENRDYHPESLLQPADVAEIVLACLALPATAEVVDLHIRPRQKQQRR